MAAYGKRFAASASSSARLCRLFSSVAPKTEKPCQVPDDTGRAAAAGIGILKGNSSSSSGNRNSLTMAFMGENQIQKQGVRYASSSSNSGSGSGLGGGYSPLKDSSSSSSRNWSNRPPKETIMLDGCDYEHWLIVLEFPKDPKPSEEEMVNTYVKTLSAVVGSEEEAKKRIYSVSTHTYTGFGCLVSEELSYKIKAQPGVLWVLPDSYIDVPNKDYGGDLFVDGKVIPRPQYRYPERQQGRNDRSSRSRTRFNNQQMDRRQPMPMGPRSAAPTQSNQMGGMHAEVRQPASGGFPQQGGNLMGGMYTNQMNRMQEERQEPMWTQSFPQQGGNQTGHMHRQREEPTWTGAPQHTFDKNEFHIGNQTGHMHRQREEPTWTGAPQHEGNQLGGMHNNPVGGMETERREPTPTEIPQPSGHQ